MSQATDVLARRSIMSGMGIGLVAAGALGATGAQAQTARNRIVRHPEDNWLDRPNAAHRLVIDSTTPDGGGGALAFANNFFEANKTGYRLDAPEIAVVVVLRHFSTPVAYNDAMWGKYGAVFAAPSKFTDPKTNTGAGDQCLQCGGLRLQPAESRCHDRRGCKAGRPIRRLRYGDPLLRHGCGGFRQNQSGCGLSRVDCESYSERPSRRGGNCGREPRTGTGIYLRLFGLNCVDGG